MEDLFIDIEPGRTIQFITCGNDNWPHADCQSWDWIDAPVLWAIVRHWGTPKRIKLWRNNFLDMFYIYIDNEQKFQIDTVKFSDFLLGYCVKGSERWISKNPDKIDWRKEGF